MPDNRKDLLIIGAGGFGRENLPSPDHPLYKVKGFLDSRTHILDTTPRRVSIIGDPLSYEPLPDEVFMVALGDPRQRFKYTQSLREVHNAAFPAIIHSQANYGEHVSVGQGCIISPRVSIAPDVHIGSFSCIQEYTVVGHDARIGDWCQINSHCTISGGAKIGNFVTIHPNCVITSRAVLGDGVIVAPGSVVVGKIPAGITIIGNPARRFTF